MAGTCYFDETINDQGGKSSMKLEIGRSSFYQENSIYIKVGDNLVIMDRAMAKKFVDAVASVGRYHGFID